MFLIPALKEPSDYNKRLCENTIKMKMSLVHLLSGMKLSAGALQSCFVPIMTHTLPSALERIFFFLLFFLFPEFCWKMTHFNGTTLRSRALINANLRPRPRAPGRTEPFGRWGGDGDGLLLSEGSMTNKVGSYGCANCNLSSPNEHCA